MESPPPTVDKTAGKPAGPIFAQPLGRAAGEVLERDGFVSCDLIPA
jgi:hypothetical protein